MKLKITKSTVDTVREMALSTAKRHYVFDTELSGFGLSATGKGAVSYFVEYRMPEKRRRTIGKHGPLTPQEARSRAKALLGEVANGVDVARRPRGNKTFAEAFEAYMRHVCQGKSSAETRRLIEYDALPAWRTIPMSEIERADVARMIDRIASRSPSVARALFAQLRPLFRWSVERGYAENNPMADLKAPHPSKPRDRVLRHDELLCIWNGAEQNWFPFGPITRLLILTGQRVSEVAGMTRDELEGDVWTIPGERTKNGKIHQVDLHPLAMEVLENLPRVHSLIFTTTGRNKPSGFSKAKRHLDQLVPDIPHWRFHDLRRTVASGMAALGILPNVIERVLNHQSGSNAGLIGVYQRHEYRVERRDAIMAWGDHVADLIGGRNA